MSEELHTLRLALSHYEEAKKLLIAEIERLQCRLKATEMQSGQVWFSKSQAARRLGVSPTTINRWIGSQKLLLSEQGKIHKSQLEKLHNHKRRS